MKKNKWVELCMVLMLLLAVYLLSRQAAIRVANMKSIDQSMQTTEEQESSEIAAKKQKEYILW